MTRSWQCAECQGDGMYPTATGMRVCDCEAGKSRREYLGMSAEERRREARRKREKAAEAETQQEIPF